MKKTTSKATIKRSRKTVAKEMPRSYRLPDGRLTTSVQKYLNTWNKIGGEFGNIIGGSLLSYDPTLSYKLPDSVHTYSFDPLMVMKILKAVGDAEMKGYESGRRCARDYDYTYY